MTCSGSHVAVILERRWLRSHAKEVSVDGQVTLTLPAEVLERAQLWAQRAGRPVADLLAETIELSLRPLGTPSAEVAVPLTGWSDDEVLAAAETEMDPTADARLSELLSRQQAGSLTEPERGELAALMQLYQEGLLRKARALREAVRRGLRGPLEP
jgi:hypothetical protein